VKDHAATIAGPTGAVQHEWGMQVAKGLSDRVELRGPTYASKAFHPTLLLTQRVNRGLEVDASAKALISG
jgi:hypothetical protein